MENMVDYASKKYPVLICLNNNNKSIALLDLMTFTSLLQVELQGTAKNKAMFH